MSGISKQNELVSSIRLHCYKIKHLPESRTVHSEQESEPWRQIGKDDAFSRLFFWLPEVCRSFPANTAAWDDLTRTANWFKCETEMSLGCKRNELDLSACTSSCLPSHTRLPQLANVSGASYFSSQLANSQLNNCISGVVSQQLVGSLQVVSQMFGPNQSHGVNKHTLLYQLCRLLVYSLITFLCRPAPSWLMSFSFPGAPIRAEHAHVVIRKPTYVMGGRALTQAWSADWSKASILTSIKINVLDQSLFYIQMPHTCGVMYRLLYSAGMERN